MCSKGVGEEQINHQDMHIPASLPRTQRPGLNMDRSIKSVDIQGLMHHAGHNRISYGAYIVVPKGYLLKGCAQGGAQGYLSVLTPTARGVVSR